MYIIDNIVTAINCGNTSKLLNDKVNKFTNQKKLKLSDKKCANIQIEEKKLQKLNVLKRILVTEFQGHSCSSKSTGLWNFRRNWGNIKRYTFWKLEDSNWSPVEEGLVFKNSCLTNSEIWIGISDKDLNHLEIIDNTILRVITGSKAKVPIEMLHPETAELPISHVISVRRLSYWHNIIRRNGDDLVNQVYKAMKEKPLKGDWIHL